MHPCVPHYTLPKSPQSFNSRVVSLHALPNSTRSPSPCAVLVHALSHFTHCLIPYATSLNALPLSTRCLTLRATYVANLTQSHSTRCFAPRTFSHYTRCLALHILSTNLIIAVDKYWNTENNFIEQRLLCENCSKCLSAM